MSIQRLLLLPLLLLLPCVCSATDGLASIVGKVPVNNTDECSLSYCLKTFHRSCDRHFFWDKKSLCIFLTCRSEASCDRLLEELAKGQDGHLIAPFSPSSAPHTPLPAPGPPLNPTGLPDPQPLSSNNSTAAPSPVESSNTSSSLENGHQGPANPPRVSTDKPAVNNTNAPAASPSAAYKAPPQAPGSERTPAAGAEGNKVTPKIKTTPDSSPEVPAPTAPATTNAIVMTTATSTTTTTTVTTSTTVTNATTITMAATTNTTATASPPRTTTTTTTTTVPPTTTTLSTTTNTTTAPTATTESITRPQTASPSPSPTATTAPPPVLPTTHPVLPTEGRKPSVTTPKPPENPLTGRLPHTKGEERDQAGQGFVEAAGEPLTIHVVNTSSLLAVLMFGLLFFVVTVVLFLRQAYESYKRKDYTQVDYLINGMYSDSGV
ncbi:uncharacterized protein C11orf24 homolog [Salminus brasiliensis]|uniref:uncharacterized protein C11orf24 homolog n=1 Tax=Salminus brasiliensis TaxID=930266 RepID=UPI003B833CF8